MPSWAYSGCRFCMGRGCVACDGERERDSQQVMEQSFNNPVLVVKGLPDQDPQGWEILKRAFNREAIEKAFSADGGGSFEVQENVYQAKEELGIQLEPLDALKRYLNQVQMERFKDGK